MPDEDNNFGGSLVSDFRKFWRHMQPKNTHYLHICTFTLQNFMAKTTLPESFMCLFDPQRILGNPLRAVFSQIKIFPAIAKFPSLLRGDL